jgi:hypothetical protein
MNRAVDAGLRMGGARTPPLMLRTVDAQDQAAWQREQMKEKLAQLKKQKAKAKEAAEEAALAAVAPKPVDKAKTMHAKKGLNLSRRDKQLLDIATTQIKKHHAEELAEERKDQAAEKALQQAKDKAHAIYLVCCPCVAVSSVLIVLGSSCVLCVGLGGFGV